MSLVYNFVNDNGQRDALELNEDFYRIIALTQDDGVTPFSLAGATGRMMVRKTKDGAVLLDFATSEVNDGGTPPAPIGGMTIDASGGLITLYKTKAQCVAALPEGFYLYDIVITIGGKPACVYTGVLQAVQGVTR